MGPNIGIALPIAAKRVPYVHKDVGDRGEEPGLI